MVRYRLVWPRWLVPAVALWGLGCGLGGRYEREDVMIPMRDGVRLHTEVYTPRGTREPLPILLTRTPYGLNHDARGLHTALRGSYADLAADGYIFVFQDIRGRYESEGQFVMLRPPRDRSDSSAIDESTDTYDTIEWVLANTVNNGRVGVLGISYGGWLTVMAMIDPHPAVAAASPQASPADMFIGDDFLHNGAFRLGPGFGYAALMERGRTNRPFGFEGMDTYDWYLELGPLANVNARYFQDSLPTWNAFMANPTYTEYWQRQSVPQYLTSVTVPTLNVAGWWDAEDFYGPMTIYETLERYDTSEVNYLVVGPWRHGGWAADDGATLGEVSFGSETARYFREQVQAPFFAYYLKGDGAWNVEEALAFETGGNRWQQYGEWPPPEVVDPERAYLGAGGRLTFDPPSAPEPAYVEYVSDPGNPVPYMPRPIPGFWQGGQALWKVTDQRFVTDRSDVVSWQTSPLESDVIAAGRIEARLFASTTGTDADWVVKLIDVYPESFPENPERGGFQLMVADEVLRAKFRNSFAQPEPVPPNEVVEYRIDLNSRHHRFRRGHRIMVQIQSSWFPLIDRNPQTFVDIPTASAGDYRPATHRIYHTPAFPSQIVLPVRRPDASQ